MIQSFGGIHSSVYNFPNAGTIFGSTSSGASPMFTVQWLSGTQIRMCYGCASPIRTDTSTVPSPPHDLIIRYKERRYYRDPITKDLKLTPKEQNTYYHLMKTCVLIKHPGFRPNLLHIPPDLLSSLSETHKLHIYENFGIRCPWKVIISLIETLCDYCVT